MDSSPKGTTFGFQLPYPAAFLAGKVFVAYRRSRWPRGDRRCRTSSSARTLQSRG